GIMKCDIIAAALLAAYDEIDFRVPLVVRLEGTNADIGKSLLERSGRKIITADGLTDAARKVVAAAKGAARVEIHDDGGINPITYGGLEALGRAGCDTRPGARDLATYDGGRHLRGSHRRDRGGPPWACSHDEGYQPVRARPARASGRAA